MDIAKHIVLATDFSEAAGQALDYAIQLSQKLGARLTVLHFYEIPAAAYSAETYISPDTFKMLEDAARAQLAGLMKKIQARLPQADSVLKLGPPAELIAAEAQRLGADMIVMGTHGRRGLSHVFLGSVAEKTLRNARVPVLVLHAAPGKQAAA